MARKVVVFLDLTATRSTSCGVSLHGPWCWADWRRKGLAWAWSEWVQAHRTPPPRPPSPPGNVPPAVGNHALRWRGKQERAVEGGDKDKGEAAGAQLRGLGRVKSSHIYLYSSFFQR